MRTTSGLPCDDEPVKQEDKVTDLNQRLNCQLVQANGQRILGPLGDWVGPAPVKGSEVFVGRLPRDMLEDEIVPVFERMGKIYRLRVMMDFSGCNRGYGFVEYSCKEEADRAINELNDYEIRRGHRIRVVRSVDNCRLFFGGLPRHLTKADIYENVSRLVPNVKDVIVYTSADELSQNQNRGFCFVEFNDHKSAAMARRHLIPMRNDLFLCPLTIDWVVPEPEIDAETMKTVKNLYVGNLTASVTEEQLMDLFDAVNPGSVERVVVIKGHYAFVNFHERRDALAAIEKLNDTYLEGSMIRVNLAKPAANFLEQENNRLRHYSQSNADRREMQDTVRMQYHPSGISMFLQRNPNGRIESQRVAQRRTPKYDMMTPPPTNNSPLYGRMVNGTQQSLMATVSNGRAQTADWHQIVPRNISYVGLLERLCQCKGYGEPNFMVTRAPKKDVSSGRDVNYFIYQVSAPGWGNGRWLHPPSLMDSEPAAKELAAQFALLRLSYPTMDDQEIVLEMMRSGVLAQENQLLAVTVPPPPPTEVVARPNLHSGSGGSKSFSTGSQSYESWGNGSPCVGGYPVEVTGVRRNRLNPSAPEFVLNENVVIVHGSYGYPMPMGNSPSAVGSAGPMQSLFYPQSPPSYPPPPMSMWPQKGGEGLDCARMMRGGFNDQYGGNIYRSAGGNGHSTEL